MQPDAILRVSFVHWLDEPVVVAEGPEAAVREAIHPFLAGKMGEGFTLADLLPWLDWEVVGAR